jgi:hypothetical protein
MLPHSRRRKYDVRATLSVLLVLLCGCAPVTADHCAIRVMHDGNLEANVTLTNGSFKDVVHTTVLVNVDRSSQLYHNRIFEVVARLHPGETRSVEGHSTDASLYEFKDSSFPSRGCEVEYVTFADGTRWELPTPL